MIQSTCEKLQIRIDNLYVIRDTKFDSTCHECNKHRRDPQLHFVEQIALAPPEVVIDLDQQKAYEQQLQEAQNVRFQYLWGLRNLSPLLMFHVVQTLVCLDLCGNGGASYDNCLFSRRRRCPTTTMTLQSDSLDPIECFTPVIRRVGSCGCCLVHVA